MIESKVLSQMIFWGVWLVIPLLWEIIGAVAAAMVILVKFLSSRKIRMRDMQRILLSRGGEMTAAVGAGAAEGARPVEVATAEVRARPEVAATAEVRARPEVGGTSEKAAMGDYCPTVSFIVPVFNSESTLEGCLRSILEQEYPVDRLEVLLVDNGSKDGSRAVFEQFQTEHGKLRLWWHTSEQGKSRALNMGVFSGSGRYVINIDSDGRLDQYAISNIVRRFEEDARIVAMTGVVLTDHEQIGGTVGNSPAKTSDVLTDHQQIGSTVGNRPAMYMRILKLIQQCELFEYCESFLVGRSFQSIFNFLHTMAGAFSCFRREALLKTQLYNTETMGEDAHMTSQLRQFSSGRVELCEDAFYFTQPLENIDKLYTQRQRWQRAELEVAGLFKESHLGGMVAFLKKPALRRLVSSHTLAFPRLIWLFAMIYLYFVNYPLELLVGANVLLYAAYILLSLLNISVACLYLENQQKVRGYLIRHMYICLLLPFYRFLLYWIRMSGIINSLTTSPKWRTRTFSEEVEGARREAGKAVRKRFGFMYALERIINGGKRE